MLGNFNRFIRDRPVRDPLQVVVLVKGRQQEGFHPGIQPFAFHKRLQPVFQGQLVLERPVHDLRRQSAVTIIQVVFAEKLV